MKLQFRQIEPFLKKLDPAMRAVLVYGPDSGLVRERGSLLSKQVVSDIKDPFNTSHLDGDSLVSDLSRLIDEANAGSLMGGRRVVRVTNAGNQLAPHLKTYLKQSPNPNCLILLEAGDLKPKDALRKVCEDAVNAAALPCYIDDEKAVTTFIRDSLKIHGIAIHPDAATWFAANIKGDRMRINMELEKLLLYIGAYSHEISNSKQQKTVTLEDVQNSSGEAGTQNIDELVYAFADRNLQISLKAYHRLIDEGVSLIAIVRSLQNHVFRLHAVKVQNEKGIPLVPAMKSLQPAIFYKQEEQFISQVQSFSLKQLHILLQRLNEMEARCKQSGVSGELIMNYFLLRSTS